jgi:mRNA interferase HicA
LDLGRFRPILAAVTGTEFIRKVMGLGRRTGTRVRISQTRGKGDHETLYYGDRYTIVGDRRRELKTGTLHAMLRQLGLTLDDINR